ncbi:MAG: oxygen-independent coproporphyrinogen III oxidase [bacterium]|nr:oxygen-independent coproporphyrinogen III oxidase [bacterium]
MDKREPNTLADISDDEIRALVERYNTRGPRYTSYPTAPQWTKDVNGESYRQVLRACADPAPIALYVHIPFCRQLCLYCACNTRVTGKQELISRYLDALKREITTVANLFGDRPRLAQIHFGGGTPTFLSPEQLEGVIEHLDAHFDRIPGAERSLEVDPRVTTLEHLEMLHRQGFQRVSAGVQDLDETVQQAVKREFSAQQLRDFVAQARGVGFEGVNVDLIYGLPHQTPETWARTLDTLCAIRPDRLAVFGYAHVPWMKRHQKSLEKSGLPTPPERLALAIQARRAFVEAGYLAIGLDHFAVEGDELAVAFREGTVHRNFMGYSVQHVDSMVAFGASAIGDFPAAYVHNQNDVDEYIELIENQGLAVTRGHVMSAEDRMRRRIIIRLMGNFSIIPSKVEGEFGIDFAEHFAAEIAHLDRLVEDGVLRRDELGWHATLAGTFVIRNVAMLFDRYLESDHSTASRYSKTI